MEKDSKADVSHISHVDTLDHPSHDAVLIATEVESSDDSPWTLSMFRLYAVLALAYLCGCLNGFDGSLMGYALSIYHMNHTNLH